MLGQLHHSGVHVVLLAAGNRDVGATLGERLRDGEVDAGRAAEDHDGLPAEVELDVHQVFLSLRAPRRIRAHRATDAMTVITLVELTK